MPTSNPGFVLDYHSLQVLFEVLGKVFYMVG